MSDQSYRHQLDDHDEVLSVHSQDILEVLSKGPIESPVTRESTDAERAELYKHMAFEADRSLKALELKMQRVTDRCQMLQERLHETKKLARKADDELANLQRAWCDNALQAGEHDRYIDNARAALTAAKDGWP